MIKKKKKTIDFRLYKTHSYVYSEPLYTNIKFLVNIILISEEFLISCDFVVKFSVE